MPDGFIISENMEYFTENLINVFLRFVPMSKKEAVALSLRLLHILYDFLLLLQHACIFIPVFL